MRTCEKYDDIKNNAWLTVNNDVRVTSEAICQYFSYTLFYVVSTQFCWKQSSISDFAIVAKDGLFWLCIVTSPQLICVVTRTLGIGIVTSYASIILARPNWCKGDLHKWIATVDIDFSPPGIRGIACKKYNLSTMYRLSRMTNALTHMYVTRPQGVRATGLIHNSILFTRV